MSTQKLMKEKKQLETQLLTALVPIEQKSSTDFPDFVHSLFPKCNRDGEAQTRDDLKKQLEKEGKEGWNMKDLLKDLPTVHHTLEIWVLEPFQGILILPLLVFY